MAIADKLTQLKTDFDDVYTAGQTDERTQLWNTFQNNGGNQNVYYAFAYDRFTDETFNPTHDIICTEGTNSGARAFYSATKITDTKVGIYANSNNADYFFSGMTSLITIRLFYVQETTRLNSTFANNKSLKNLSVGGTIGQDIDTSPCPLTKASIESVYEHLSTTASGKTATFNSNAVVEAFGSTAAWDEYVAGKPNWTYVLK